MSHVADIKAKVGNRPFIKLDNKLPLILWHPYARHYYFCVVTEKEQKKWLAVLRDCVRHSNNGTTQRRTNTVRCATSALLFFSRVLDVGVWVYTAKPLNATWVSSEWRLRQKWRGLMFPCSHVARVTEWVVTVGNMSSILLIPVCEFILRLVAFCFAQEAVGRCPIWVFWCVKAQFGCLQRKWSHCLKHEILSKLRE